MSPNATRRGFFGLVGLVLGASRVAATQAVNGRPAQVETLPGAVQGMSDQAQIPPAIEAMVGRFLRHACEIAPGKALPTAAGYSAFEAWQAATGEHVRISRATFQKAVTNLGYPAKRIRQGGKQLRAFDGLSLKTGSAN